MLIRRITAVILMAVVLLLACALVWRVYLHHERGTPEETTFVSVPAEPA